MKDHILYHFICCILMVFLSEKETIAQQRVNTAKQINSEELVTFKISYSKESINIAPYVTAISNANFDSYRLIDARRTIRFDSGIEAELLSANELSNIFPERMKKVILTKKDVENSPQPIFKLNEDGVIIAIHPMIIKQSEEKKMR